MRGKTVVITGATSGIGLVAAESLARQGARIVLTARDAGRGRTTLDRLIRANPDAAHELVLADLSTIAQMKRAGEALLAKAPRIDVLINNAGAIFERREVTADGLEKTFAVNHMAYFVITEVVRPGLAPDARIVSTASTAHAFAKLDFADLQTSRGYSAFGAYGRSKLCNVLWTRELARRLAGTAITANCVHPGGVNTNFGGELHGVMGALMSLGKRMMLTPEQGADTLIWLAAARQAAGRTGGYWTKRKMIEPSAAARDAEAGRRLWTESARIAGLPA